MILLFIEWFSAVVLVLFTLWYPATSGWRRVVAPLCGIVGSSGFCIVALTADVYAMAAVNALFAALNVGHACRAWRAR